MHVPVRRGAFDEGEVVIHGCVVVGGGAVPEAVVHSSGNQRCGRWGLSFGCGGVVRFAQVVVVHVYRAKVHRSAVEVERNLVRDVLVLRRLLCNLRGCH